ncbi:hypothetical protein D3C71_2199060 [compost metagenome]
MAVVRLTIEDLTAKFKFGQNLPDAHREAMARLLEERGRPDDQATAELMRKYAPPHHQHHPEA